MNVITNSVRRGLVQFRTLEAGACFFPMYDLQQSEGVIMKTCKSFGGHAVVPNAVALKDGSFRYYGQEDLVQPVPVSAVPGLIVWKE